MIGNAELVAMIHCYMNEIPYLESGSLVESEGKPLQGVPSSEYQLIHRAVF